MRIFNTIKNSVYALLSYVILAVLAIIVRKIFINTLSVELLGYEGLFGNVFALLALADLGIESLILYRMFPAFANKKIDDINRNMAVYKLLYKYVGIAILVIGCALIPFLKLIVTDNNLDWNYVYVIYFVQLVTTLCTYFLAYKRLLFTVSQQEFECTKIDTVISLIFNIVKIIVLIILKNYIIYLFCNLVTNFLSNFIISKRVDKKFNYFNSRYKATLADIKQLGLGREIKDNLTQKISGTIYGGTDNIVVSILLGIRSVGLLSNYLMIGGYVTNFMTKMLKPFQMAIGNHIYSSDEKSGYDLFRMFDLISFFIASEVAICYICLFNPFIGIWIGDEYQLDQQFVLAFALNQYIMWNHQFLCFYRYSFGRYELDKYSILIAAMINVILSVVLCKPFGISGIMIGTLVGQFGFWIGRVRVVYTEYIRENVLKYIVRQAVRLGIISVELLVACGVCEMLSKTVMGFVGRVFIAMGLPCIMNVFLFMKTEEMKNIVNYIKKTFWIIKNKEK